MADCSDWGVSVDVAAVRSHRRPSQARKLKSAAVLQHTIPTGRPVLVFELSRPSPSTTSSQLAEMAQRWVSWGADALVVPTDAEATSTGPADLLAVCRAVSVPVLQRDWILHPLQVLYHNSTVAGASRPLRCTCCLESGCRDCV